MIEPGTGMVALGVALGGKDILVKLLGPTADYLGGGLKDFTSQRVENIRKIFSNAAKKLGPSLDKEGGVPPKVLKGILDDGSFANDSLTISYFGGVLASSKTGISRDDRGAYFNSLISRLSTYQLRSHYVFYHLFNNIFSGEDISADSSEGRNRLKIFIPLDTYVKAMGFIDEELNDLPTYITHALTGLAKENIIDPFYSAGPKEYLQESAPQITGEGMLVTPSSLGVELFLWAYGKGKNSTSDFFLSREKFEIDSDVEIIGSPVRIIPK